jgi:hypothetical protein
MHIQKRVSPIPPQHSHILAKAGCILLRRLNLGWRPDFGVLIILLDPTPLLQSNE